MLRGRQPQSPAATGTPAQGSAGRTSADCLRGQAHGASAKSPPLLAPTLRPPPQPAKEQPLTLAAAKSRGLRPPQEEEFESDVPQDLGPLLFVKLRKHHWLVDDAWFCDRVTVQGPGTCAEAAFPCYRWVQGLGMLSLPEGTGEGGRALGGAGWGKGGRRASAG